MFEISPTLWRRPGLNEPSFLKGTYTLAGHFLRELDVCANIYCSSPKDSHTFYRNTSHILLVSLHVGVENRRAVTRFGWHMD